MPKAGGKTWRSKARDEAAVAASTDPMTIQDAADALTMAAMQGNVEAVSIFLDGGADADCKDAIGVAPLHWAAFCGHGEVTGRLLAAQADVHVRDQEGRTPLHVASYESHVDVMRKLIFAGADVMAPDKLGWTPLHCAVSNGEDLACKHLTESGADPQQKDAEGKSSMDLAKHFGNEAIVGILEAAQEQRELLALKNMGIGSHRPSRSPTSVSSNLAEPVAAS